MQTPLAARQLFKSWLGKPVLKGIDLDLHAGSVTVLFGANGAGKSTLIGLLAGDQRPDRGVVKVAGHDLATAADAGRAALVHVAQSPPLAPFLSTLEHADAMIGWRGLPADDTRALVQRHAAALGLDRALERPTRVLSGGMRQKAALCLGLAARSEVLLLDEPHAGLDIPSALALRTLLRARRDEGGAILIASHLAEAALAIADRVLVLSGGRLALDLDTHDLAALDHDARAFEERILAAMDTGDAVGSATL